MSSGPQWAADQEELELERRARKPVLDLEAKVKALNTPTVNNTEFTLWGNGVIVHMNVSDGEKWVPRWNRFYTLAEAVEWAYQQIPPK